MAPAGSTRGKRQKLCDTPDALARTEPLAIVDQAAGVAGDVNGELVCGTRELAEVRIIHRQPVYIVLEDRDLLAGPVLVAVPEQPLDAVQRSEQAGTLDLVAMRYAAGILVQNRQTHGDVEPVQHVLGFRGDQLG